jgi:hypothetical protein
MHTVPEIAAALPRWMATLRFCNQISVERRSPVTVAIRRPSKCKKSLASAPKASIVPTAQNNL